MNTNKLPNYDASDNPTGCCPRFKPNGWDRQTLHFDGKAFVRAQTRSLFHIPLNMSRVFKKTFAAIEAAGAQDTGQFIVLSHEISPWSAEHNFAVTKEVLGEEMCRLSGHFMTKVFEGSYRNAPNGSRKWRPMLRSVSSAWRAYTSSIQHARNARGNTARTTWWRWRRFIDHLPTIPTQKVLVHSTIPVLAVR